MSVNQMEPNFVLAPGSDPLAVLWNVFPELRDALDDGDPGPYYLYARFADHLASHRNDHQLWQRAYTFFDELAVGGGSLQEILVVTLFESLCDDPLLADRLKSNLGPGARKLLQDMQ